MKMKLFLCVLCLALFADGLLSQTASVDEAARLTRIEVMVAQRGELLRSMAADLREIKSNSHTEFMWSVSLVLAIFVVGYALVHQMRTQFSDFMVKLLDMHLQTLNRMKDLQVEMAQLRGEMNAKFAKAEGDTLQLRGEMNAKFAEVQTDMIAKMADLQGDISDVKSDLRGDISDVKIDVGDVKKDVAIIQNDVAGTQNDVGALTEKVDGIDAHVREVERNTSAQLNDIRETLAKQQEINSDTTKQEPNVGPPTEE